MAFLFAHDRKPLREEELAASRVNSRMPSRQPSVRGYPGDSLLPTPDAQTEYANGDKGPLSPSPASTPARRNIVLPDHVAFR